MQILVSLTELPVQQNDHVALLLLMLKAAANAELVFTI
jgi:hypothetical protein